MTNHECVLLNDILNLRGKKIFFRTQLQYYVIFGKYKSCLNRGKYFIRLFRGTNEKEAVHSTEFKKQEVCGLEVGCIPPEKKRLPWRRWAPAKAFLRLFFNEQKPMEFFIVKESVNDLRAFRTIETWRRKLADELGYKCYWTVYIRDSGQDWEEGYGRLHFTEHSLAIISVKDKPQTLGYWLLEHATWCEFKYPNLLILNFKAQGEPLLLETDDALEIAKTLSSNMPGIAYLPVYDIFPRSHTPKRKNRYRKSVSNHNKPASDSDSESDEKTEGNSAGDRGEWNQSVPVPEDATRTCTKGTHVSPGSNREFHFPERNREEKTYSEPADVVQNGDAKPKTVDGRLRVIRKKFDNIVIPDYDYEEVVPPPILPKPLPSPRIPPRHERPMEFISPFSSLCPPPPSTPPPMLRSPSQETPTLGKKPCPSPRIKRAQASKTRSRSLDSYETNMRGLTGGGIVTKPSIERQGESRKTVRRGKTSAYRPVSSYSDADIEIPPYDEKEIYDVSNILTHLNHHLSDRSYRVSTMWYVNALSTYSTSSPVNSPSEDQPPELPPRMPLRSITPDPRSVRVSSSEYLSAMNICHTLRNVLHHDPPVPDTLKLPSPVRLRVCMQLYITNLGSKDWRDLADTIGLEHQAVELIEAFTAHHNQETAAEIVLRHWQFRYNRYGYDKVKCRIRCHKAEFVSMLTEMQRHDIVSVINKGSQNVPYYCR